MLAHRCRHTVRRSRPSRPSGAADDSLDGPCLPTTFIAAPIRATSVKRAYEADPVTTCAAGLGLTVLLDPSS